MAKNTGNNRIGVKWVRDKAKSAYVKQECCYICGSTEDLELHHLHSITILLNTWADKYSHDISTDEGILSVRDEFIEVHKHEIYDLVFTLCNSDHIRLHGVYGKAPAPNTVEKQKRWLEIQKAKLVVDKTLDVVKTLSTFSSFY